MTQTRIGSNVIASPSSYEEATKNVADVATKAAEGVANAAAAMRLK